MTKNALISLLHLSHEMMAENKDKASVSSVYSAVRVLVILHSIKTFWNVTEHVFCMYQDFISQWSLGNEAAAEDASASQLGLAWLIPLWVDRDQEVWTVSVFSFSLIHDNLNIYSNICKLYTV